MQYLITFKNGQPFFTKWFEPENHFNADIDMVVYDCVNCCYTKDGINWIPILIDTL